MMMYHVLCTHAIYRTLSLPGHNATSTMMAQCRGFPATLNASAAEVVTLCHDKQKAELYQNCRTSGRLEE